MKKHSARETLIALALKNNNSWDAIYKDITEYAPVSEEYFTKAKTINAITMLDKEYPEELKSTYKPPFVIYKY